MITSSKFFDKSFFTVEHVEQKLQIQDLSPWGNSPSKRLVERGQAKPELSYIPQQQQKNRGYEISRSSSIKYVERKLKIKSLMNKQKLTEERTSSPKYFTIEQKLKQIESKKSDGEKSRDESFDKMIVVRRKKQKPLFPELNIHQYNQLKAKGNNIFANSSIDEMLQKRKHRKKLFEDFGKASQSQQLKHSQKNVNKSNQLKNFLSGRYVCAVKNPQFSVHGLPTHKLIDNI